MAAKQQDGPTSGVLAPGSVGRAAREAAKAASAGGPAVGVRPWEEPKAKYADGDESIDARMWRLRRDHIEMGARSS